MSAPTPTIPVQPLNILRDRLNHLNKVDRLSFRKIAAMPEFEDIPWSTLANIAKGRDPKDPKVRLLLHLEKPKKPTPPAWVIQAATILAMKRKQKLEGET